MNKTPIELERDRTARLRANNLMDQLPDSWEAWVTDVDVGVRAVNIVFPEREIPAGFLDIASEYGDLRIEGVDGSKVEAVVWVN